MENIKLSVVIPAYNEEKRIGPTLESINEYLNEQDYKYEIIVVANNCTDGTDDVVRKYQEIMHHLILMDLGPGIPGKGGAVREGVLKSRGGYILFMDADNSTRISEMDKFWKYFNEGFDVVFGSRDIGGANVKVRQSWIRELFGKMGNLLIQIVLLPGIKDTQCGFKSFTQKVARDIFPKQKISGWGFDMEILALALKMGYKIKEVPINWFNEPDSKVSWKGYLESFRDLFKIRMNIWLNKYDI